MAYGLQYMVLYIDKLLVRILPDNPSLCHVHVTLQVHRFGAPPTRTSGLGSTRWGGAALLDSQPKQEVRIWRVRLQLITPAITRSIQQ